MDENSALGLRFAHGQMWAVGRVTRSKGVKGRHDTQHNDTQHNDTQHNDIQHRSKSNVTLSIMRPSALEHSIVMLSVVHADCYSC